MSGGTVVPRYECPGGHFFQGDSHASDNGIRVFMNGNRRTLPLGTTSSLLLTPGSLDTSHSLPGIFALSVMEIQVYCAN